MEKEKEEEKENNEKQIVISGTSNRYQIKRLNKEPIIIRKRKEVERWDIPQEYFSEDKQLDILMDISNYNDGKQDCFILNMSLEHYKIINGLISLKIAGYRHQDVIKKRLDNNKLININNVINILKESKLKCYYCNEKVLLLYNIVREMNQWTLDRTNNDLGHNNDNCVMACLSCNLKRRRTGADAFLFTKQLYIVKKDQDYNMGLNEENTK